MMDEMGSVVEEMISVVDEMRSNAHEAFTANRLHSLALSGAVYNNTAFISYRSSSRDMCIHSMQLYI